MSRLIVSMIVIAAALGCADTAPTMPGVATSTVLQSGSPAVPPPAATGPVEPGTIGFGGLTENGRAISSYSERGLGISLTGADWTENLVYGTPLPFVQFRTPAGISATGTVEFNANGQTFSFVSVDVYSSTTKIPYRITGLRGGATVFTLDDIVPNTFGQFRTVAAAQPDAVIDTLRIALTNNAAPCCPNPMGLDNVVIR